MRRFAVLLTLLAVLALAPAAHAAVPGVNIAGIPGPTELDQAAATGAKYVRVFALRSYFNDPTAYLTFKGIVSGAAARGMKPVFVLTGAPDGSTTPPDPASFATWANTFATHMAAAGGAGAYEVWNEQDESEFWAGTPDPAKYAAIIKAAYPKLKSADPGARVLLGPLTGNNYGYLQALYDNGAGGSFDAAAVHTDTACLVDPPSSFYREDGNVARFTFLGFRTVHDVMVANGDGAKPIWMTELGWTTTGSTCVRGMWAGKKLAGVTEAAQAANLKEAYHCLTGYPYLETGLWFTLKDTTAYTDELNHYGLQRVDGSHKPSWDAFRTVAAQGDTLTGPCGDFDAPTITIKSPTADTQYTAALTISAVATDSSSVGRVTFQADGKEIRNFTGNDVASGKTVTLEWQGSKKLSYGPHKITVVALDLQGNTSEQSVTVTRVDPSKLAKTLATTVKLGSVRIKGRKASISGRILKTGALGLSGKVRIAWQHKRGSKWKTVHGGLKPANKPFKFKQKLKRSGTWRVKVTYVGVAPYKAATITSRPFQAR
jgi:Big-like domain-containing protein